MFLKELDSFPKFLTYLIGFIIGIPVGFYILKFFDAILFS